MQSTDRDLREEFGKVLSMVKEKGDHGSNFDRLEYRLATLEDRLGTDLPPGVSQQDDCSLQGERRSVSVLLDALDPCCREYLYPSF